MTFLWQKDEGIYLFFIAVGATGVLDHAFVHHRVRAAQPVTNLKRAFCETYGATSQTNAIVVVQHNACDTPFPKSSAIAIPIGPPPTMTTGGRTGAAAL